MKENRILSTAGLGLSDSNRLKTYCSLMQESLVDHWVIVDDFIESHVCFIHSDFLLNLEGSFKSKSQIKKALLHEVMPVHSPWSK